MAQKVIWTHESVTDLESVAEYIARDSAYYASAFVEEILEAGRSLGHYSKRGRIVPEIGNPKIRELFVRDYRLIYCIEGLRVIVLGLIHGKRDLKRLLKEK